MGQDFRLLSPVRGLTRPPIPHPFHGFWQNCPETFLHEDIDFFFSYIPTSPSQPRTALREPQPLAAGAQLGHVEEEAGADDANTPAAFQRAANIILGRPYDRSNLTFGRGHHAGFIQAQRHALSQYSPQINQNQIEDPFEGSVHSFDNNVKKINVLVKECFRAVLLSPWKG